MICSYLIFPLSFIVIMLFFFRGKKLIFFVCRFCLFKVKVQEHSYSMKTLR